MEVEPEVDNAGELRETRELDKPGMLCFIPNGRCLMLDAKASECRVTGGVNRPGGVIDGLGRKFATPSGSICFA